jgi:hypothetical protein
VIIVDEPVKGKLHVLIGQAVDQGRMSAEDAGRDRQGRPGAEICY